MRSRARVPNEKEKRSAQRELSSCIKCEEALLGEQAHNDALRGAAKDLWSGPSSFPAPYASRMPTAEYRLAQGNLTSVATQGNAEQFRRFLFKLSFS